MHLINVETLKLEKFDDSNIPKYAILSHTWGTDEEEVTFQDIRKRTFEKTGNGVEKLKGCCNQARVDGLRYAWIDTCCINKDSTVELSEAINSMFQWYEKAETCYAYLSDVPEGDDPWSPESKFFSSRWFRRGWTLQELLAPRKLRFYNQQWHFMGTKGDLSNEIETITGISTRFLHGWQDFRTASVAQRLSWAAKRKTKRKEDAAYCLLGIFDVTFPMTYGEGDKAMRRLQEAIMQNTGDHSILAWGLNLTPADSTPKDSADVVSAGVLAYAPSDFVNSRDIVARRQDPTPVNSFNISGGRLEVHLALHTTLTGEVYGLLNCGPEQNENQVVAIPLHKDGSSTTFDEYLRPRGRNAVLLPRPTFTTTTAVRIQTNRQIRTHRATNRRLWLHIEGHQKINLSREEDYPPVTWENERAMIAEAGDSDGNATRRYMARFRTQDDDFRDVVVVVEFEMLETQVQARCYAVTLSRDTALENLSQNLISIWPEALNKQAARIGNLHVEVKVTPKMVDEERMLIVTLRQAIDQGGFTVDADLELEQASLKVESQRITQRVERVCVRVERQARQLKEKMVALDQTKKRLAEVEDEMKKLEETKRSLSADVEEENQRVERLTHEVNEWWERKSEVQRRLAELEKKQGLGNLHEATIEPQPDARDSKDSSDSSSAGPRLLMPVERRHGHDIDCQRYLLRAAQDGQEAVVRSLLEKDVGIEATNDHGSTSLSLAASEGHLAVAKMLLDKGANLEAKDEHGGTPLLRAASNGHEAVVRLLLEKGADREAKGRHGSTTLSVAASKRHEAVVRLLLEEGADMEARNNYGNTPLLWAAHCGQVAIVKLLLKKGADYEAKSRHGNTPLSLAASKRHEAVVRLLLEEGADTQARNNSGNTPLQCAELGNKGNRNQAVVKLLRERERSTTKATRRSATNSLGSAIASLSKKMTVRPSDRQRETLR